MTITKQAIAGTLESSDLLVKVEPSDQGKLDIMICSEVIKQFGKQIRRVVVVEDKAALDYAIRARVQAAVLRRLWLRRSKLEATIMRVRQSMFFRDWLEPPCPGAPVTRLEKKYRIKWLSAGIVSALLLLNALACSSGKLRASAPVSPPVVEVAPVVQRDVPVQGEWVGTLQGYVNAQIQPQVSGYLIRQEYREGAFVKKGQLLFEIDPRPFQAALDQAKGQLAMAEAQMANAEMNVKRDVPEAEAHAIPQSQLDTDTQSLNGAKAAVEADRAAVETAQLNLGYTRVISLINGVAGVTTVQVGNLVGPSTVLTAVSQVSPIKVYFPISEQEYLRIADGGSQSSVAWLTHASRIPLQLTLADGSTYPHPGTIAFADRQVNVQTGTIQIVGEFPNPKNLLRPGQYARVRAVTGNIMGALMVPQAAVSKAQGSYEVTVITPDNRAHLRAVQVGPTEGTLWVISSGVKTGERVVAVGAEKVKDGDLVNPAPFLVAEER